MQNIQIIKRELLINELALSQAINERNLEKMAELKIQRDNLKNMLIEALIEENNNLQLILTKVA